MTRRLLPGALLLGASVLALAGCSSASGAPAGAGATPTASTATATALPSPTSDPLSDSAPLALGGALPAGARVTIVGDSIVRGLGLDPGQAWPALVGDDLGWNVVNLGCDGGGFIEPGDCGVAIGDRAEEIADTRPDAIVLIASSNDLGWTPEEVADAMGPAVQAIAEASPSAKLIALDSVWGPDPRPEDLDAYDAALVGAVDAASGIALEYPDPLRADGLLAEDGVHPTAEGQVALADAFVLAAEKAGLGQAIPGDQRATDAPG
ncbi:SGNH/GDSL hydrolase family protein [Rathayibacter sp. VKM Ac-2927]|uniref:SGNH/GDSL hydrolase family protein n=1 Tax=Rathayibacter sp. VKM Ac-2927 TaxID=2929478 RepID=UPI001FB24F45|nr:SGNH/GDSL hydrolase family protein [Rathayibacter sp. VKM Ac-2927]MCJ1687889.1 SGNH/GDSL hydrolase family protein [Rathayibacter sp. VKM Ac-2927]